MVLVFLEDLEYQELQVLTLQAVAVAVLEVFLLKLL
jgi:hypothetical protein